MSLGRQDHFLQIVLPTTEKDNEGFSVQMDKEVAKSTRLSRRTARKQKMGKQSRLYNGYRPFPLPCHPFGGDYHQNAYY